MTTSRAPGFINDANTLFLARLDQGYDSLPGVDVTGRADLLRRKGSGSAGFGPSPVAGLLNGARQFGAAAYILAGRSVENGDSTAGAKFTENVNAFQDDCTVEIVLKPAAFSGDPYVFLFGRGSACYFGLYLDSATGRPVFFWSAGASHAFFSTTTTTLTVGTWNMLTLRKTVTAEGVTPPNTRLNTLEVFLDGVFVESTTGFANPNTSGGDVTSGNCYWQIGARNLTDDGEPLGSAYFSGAIESIRVSDIARTNEEIAQSWTDFQEVEGEGSEPAPETPITLRNPAVDLAAELDSTTVGGVALITDQNLFAGAWHPTPIVPSVVLVNTGGVAPEPYLTPSKDAYFRASVQVLIYALGGKAGFQQGEALAQGVLGALQQATVTGYVSCVAQQSQPNFLGQDPTTGQLSWSLNFSVEYVA